MKKFFLVLVSLYLFWLFLFPDSVKEQVASFLYVKPHHLEHKMMVLFTIGLLSWIVGLSVIVTYKTFKLRRVEQDGRYRS